MYNQIQHLLDSKLDLNLNITEEGDFFIAKWSFKTKLQDGALKNTPKMFLKKSTISSSSKEFADELAMALMQSINNWSGTVKVALNEQNVWEAQKTQTEQAKAAKKEAEDKEKEAKAALKKLEDEIKTLSEATPLNKEALRKACDKLLKLDPLNKLVKTMVETHLAAGGLFENL